jgi:hypothetical protein
MSSCKHTVGVYNYRVWKNKGSPPLRRTVRPLANRLADNYNATERVQRTFNPILEEPSTDMFYQNTKVADAIS